MLAAYTVLLAHVVVPHQHHNGEICLETNHSQTDCDDHHSHDHHEHDENSNNEEYCTLKQLVILPADQVKIGCKTFNFKNNHNFYGFQLTLFNSELSKFELPNFRIAQIQLIAVLYSNNATTSVGLRAPPII